MKVLKALPYVSLFFIATMASSCTDNEQTTKLMIEKNCDTSNNICTFELVNALVAKQTNFLGKTVERVLSKKPLQSIKGDFTWMPTNCSGVATNVDLNANNLPQVCPSEGCQDDTNPTAYKFNPGQSSISISGTVTINDETINLTTVPAESFTTAEPQDVVIFTMPAPGQSENGETRPANISTAMIVDALNGITNSDGDRAMHGTLTADSDTQMTLTCDPGYEWLDSNTPPWGNSLNQDGPSRSIAKLDTWNGSGWNTQLPDDSETSGLGYNGTGFYIGCWEK